MPKSWKLAARDCETSRASTRKSAETKQDIAKRLLRSEGFGDDFFTAAAQWGLKVDDAKKCSADGMVSVKFVGVSGNSYSQTAKFAPIGDADPARPFAYRQQFERMHTVIAQQNATIRGFSGARIQEACQQKFS